MDLGPFPRGINNRTKKHDLPEGTLRNAVSVDIDDAGNLSRRSGMTKSYSGLNCRGGFSSPAGSFFLEDHRLMQFDGSAVTELGQGFTGDHLAHHYLDQVLYLSDGNRCVRVDSGALADWGLPIPQSPGLSATSGTLGSGVYLAAIAYVDSDGRQSGLSSIKSISLSDNSGVIIQSLPGAPSSIITAPSYLRLFLSAANGEVLYRVADVALATASYTVSAAYHEDGFEVVWQPLGPPPPGRIIRSHGGRIYIADDTGLVWYSKPGSLHLFDLAHDFLLFSEPVTVMEPVESGIFFATDSRTEFHLGADPEEGFQVVEKYNYGAPFGTGRRLVFDAQASVLWQSHRGTLIGAPDGSLRNAQEDAVPDVGTEAAGLVRERDGIRQFIASIKDGAPGTVAASSWITAEVIRRSS